MSICETCHKHLNKNEIPSRAVCNKMAVDPIPNELKDLKKLEKVLFSKRILFKKIAIMYRKSEFSKIKRSICNALIETANVCNIVPRSAVWNGLILVKLKCDLKYRGHVDFEPVRPHFIYQALTYLKSHKFYEDISVTKGLSGEDMLTFSDIDKNQEETESVTENGISNGKEMNKNNNENAGEAEYASVEHPLNMHITVRSCENMISEIPNIISEENFIIAPGQEKTPVSILGDEFCEEQAFPYLLHKSKFGYSVLRDIPVSPA